MDGSCLPYDFATVRCKMAPLPARNSLPGSHSTHTGDNQGHPADCPNRCNGDAAGRGCDLRGAKDRQVHALHELERRPDKQHNRHLALSKGVISTDNIDPAGRTVRRPALGTLQLHHEEAVGGLASYSARWGGLSIIGVY